MDSKQINDLVQYRLNDAEDKLDTSRILLENGKYKDSIGRSYYAIFASVRALLAKDKVDFSKHAGVIAYFQKSYIKEGIFDKKYSKIVQNAFQIRNNCDYADFYIASKEDAEEQYHCAIDLNSAIKEFLAKQKI